MAGATDELTAELQSLSIDTEKKIMLELKYSPPKKKSHSYKAFAKKKSDGTGTFSIDVDEIELDIEWSVKRDFLFFGRYI